MKRGSTGHLRGECGGASSISKAQPAERARLRRLSASSGGRAWPPDFQRGEREREVEGTVKESTGMVRCSGGEWCGGR